MSAAATSTRTAGSSSTCRRTSPRPTDRAGDEPERLRRMTESVDDEAERNHVLPDSDGLADRFGGLHPADLAGRILTHVRAPAAARAATSRSPCCGAASG